MLDKELEPDKYTYTFVLKACAGKLDFEEGIKIHNDVIRRQLELDVYISTGLVDMYCKMGQLDLALKVFDKMPKTDIVSWNALIDMYAKCCRLSSAETLFYETDFIKDEVSWNVIIAGYVHSRRSKEALFAFYRMKSEGLRPSAVSMISVLPAAADLTTLVEGMALHACVVRMGFQSNAHISNSLIDMYSKCGHFDCSEKLFDEMKDKDTVTWNTMMAGYAVHGHATRAIELFSQMQSENVMLDSVTFLSVLSACRHGGLVEEAKGIFNSMHDKFHHEPKLEHYACMVDLLGRGGLFNEIMSLVNKMPLEPDAALWGALLGACRMHSNSELAEVALNKLVKLEPGNSAHYIGLSNIYAQTGRWVEAKNMRLKQTDAGLKKIPGCSWV
ncbi:hypothetical protein RDABS01_024721 [Bienertia sinuspersici]